jgi:polyketide synthase PksJ
LFRTNVVYENLPAQQINENNNFEKSMESIPMILKDFDIQLALYPKEKTMGLEVEFDGKKMNRIMAQKMLDHFDFTLNQFMVSISTGKEQVLGMLSRMPNEELIELLEVGQGGKLTYGDYALSSFDKIVASDPKSVAVEFLNDSVTYGELNQKSDLVASYLIAHGVQVGDFVPIVTKRSIDMIIAIIGVLKTGAAYVPIDHQIPLERVQFILKSVDYRIILVHEDVDDEKLIGINASKLLRLCSIPEESMQNVDFRKHLVRSSNPAYVVFTSGSTGEPKGVIVSHGSLCNFGMSNLLRLNKGNKLAQLMSIELH